MRNEMEIVFDAISDNESFARVAVATFVSHLNPTLEELADIKTAVSEAVTNSIIHGYGNIYGYQKSAPGQEDAAREADSRQEDAARKEDARQEDTAPHPGKVRVRCVLEDEILHIEVSDEGRGIEDIEKAMEPLYTTRPELERSGMGFAFMEAFMDDLAVESSPGKGTVVRMERKMGIGSWIGSEE